MATKLVLVEVREVVYNYHTVTLEVPDEIGATNARIKKFAEQQFEEHMELFDCDDSERQEYDCTNIQEIDKELLEQHRKHDERSITFSCMFRRWHEATPLVELDAANLANATGYLGDGTRGVYYRIKEINTFFYASALIVTPEGSEYLFKDYESGSELRLIDHCQDECGHWCSQHGVEVEPPPAQLGRKRRAKHKPSLPTDDRFGSLVDGEF